MFRSLGHQFFGIFFAGSKKILESEPQAHVERVCLDFDDLSFIWILGFEVWTLK